MVYSLNIWINMYYTRVLFCDIVYRDIVSLLVWYDYDIESHLREVWIYDTSIVGVVGFSLLAHEEVPGRSYTRYDLVCTVICTT